MRRPIFFILIAAAILRLVGVGYGLPLWLVGDEPSFVFGALKMMELRTMVPALHHDAFIATFYYTPYLSYLYLIPFAGLAGVKFLFFSGSVPQFIQFLQTDLSHFFLASRLLSVLIGAATVYVMYRAANNIFKRETTALAAAGFLALSFLHVNFSHWGRHWVPATFVFSLVLFCLSHQVWSAKKRYLLASLVAGVGMGVTQQVGLVTIFIALWFFLVDRLSFKVFRAWWPWAAVGVFLSLTAVAYVLWPPGFYVAAGASDYIAASPKTIAGLLSGYGFYAGSLFRSEPILFFWLVVGGFVAAKERWRLLSAFILFGVAYVAAFYVLFLHVDRFLLLLYPLIVVLAGRGFTRVFDMIRKEGAMLAAVFSAAVIVLLSVGVIRYDYLLVLNDTRAQALRYAAAHIPPQSKVMVLSLLMRLPATPAAIAEQEAIDPASLRSVDAAERAFAIDATAFPRYHVLNLSSVRKEAFLSSIDEYMLVHGYEYLIYDTVFAEERVGDVFETAGTELRRFRGYAEARGDSIVNGTGDGLKQIFFSSSIGPDIVIKKL